MAIRYPLDVVSEEQTKYIFITRRKTKRPAECESYTLQKLPYILSLLEHWMLRISPHSKRCRGNNCFLRMGLYTENPLPPPPLQYHPSVNVFLSVAISISFLGFNIPSCGARVQYLFLISGPNGPISKLPWSEKTPEKILQHKNCLKKCYHSRKHRHSQCQNPTEPHFNV